jgi:hypothetical protein
VDSCAIALPEHALVRVLRPDRTFLLRHGQTGRQVVLKRIATPGRVAEARRRRLAAVEHPGLGPAPTLVEVQGLLCALRDYVQGESLAEIVRSPPDALEGLEMARQVLSALAALHARGFPHGALHPGNIVRQPGGRVRLLDGLEPFRAPPDPDDTQSLEAVIHAAPEVLRGQRASPCSDVFTFGVLLHELLARQHPFEGADWLEIVRRVLHQEPAPLVLSKADLPQRLAVVAERALAKRPARRYPDAGQLGADLGARRGVVRRAPRTGPASLVSNARRGLLIGLRSLTSEVRSILDDVATARRVPRAWRLALGAITAIGLASAVAVIGASRARDEALARKVAALVTARDLSGARRLLREGERKHPGDPMVEKLLGDVACARRDYGDCLGRYRRALEKSRRFASDRVLRANALALLPRAEERAALIRVLARLDGIEESLVEGTRSSRYWVRWNAARALEARGEPARIDYAGVYALDLLHGGSCATRRAAAARLAALGDLSALPALEQAKRATDASLFERLCMGDSVDRAIAAMRRTAVSLR